MQSPGDDRPAGERNVQRAGRRQFGLGQFPDPAGQRFFQGVFGLVGLRADFTPLVGIELGDGAQYTSDLSPPSQVAYSPLLGAIRVGDGVQFFEGLVGQRRDGRCGGRFDAGLGHDSILQYNSGYEIIGSRPATGQGAEICHIMIAPLILFPWLKWTTLQSVVLS